MADPRRFFSVIVLLIKSANVLFVFVFTIVVGSRVGCDDVVEELFAHHELPPPLPVL